ncbi:MAG: hypothetical protein ABI980_10275 [Nitrospirota bacterium]
MNEPIAPSTAPVLPPATPTDTPTNTLVFVEPHSQASITDAQAAQITRDIQKDLAIGKISQAQADARFDEMHTPLDQRVMPSDNRTDEQKLIDDHFPPARETDFCIHYYPPGQEPQVMPKELTEFDQSARTWLAGAEFPRELGNSLITTIDQVARTTKAMTPNQLEAYGQAEFSKLERAYGGEDKLQEKLHAAALMIQEIEKTKPGLQNLLRSKGIGDSALVASQLIAQSERYWGRRKGR